METKEDPYAAPEARELASVGPGPLVMALIVLLTSVAAGCAFLCTCFGVGLLTIDTFEEWGIVIAFIVGIAAAIGAAVVTSRLLARLFGGSVEAQESESALDEGE